MILAATIVDLALPWLTGIALVVSITYILYRALRRSDDPVGLATRWVVSAVVLIGTFWIVGRMFGIGDSDAIGQGGMAGGYGLAFVIAGAAATCGIILGAIWAPRIAAYVAGFVTDSFDGGQEELGPPPLYSIAEAKRKQGKYHEAVAELRKELSRHTEDFTGWLMLAETYAQDLHDVPAAQECIECILALPGLSPVKVSHALNRLADWQLNIARDLDAAREALDRVAALFPDSEQMHYARQRLAHLETTDARLTEMANPVAIHLTSHDENIGLLEDFKGLAKPTEDPAVIARRHIEQLTAHPDDCESREELAILYAAEFQRLDLAVAELEQLIEQVNRPAKQVVHWLNTLADLQVKHGGSLEAAQSALQRIIDRFPNLAAAETARHRMAYLKLELRRNEKSQTVRIGSYEQNLGLKPKA